jgi:hypothetical protein
MPGPAISLQPGPLVVAPAPFTIAATPTVPGFDVIETLPPLARDRLRKLRERRDDFHAITIRHEVLREATLERAEAENRLKKLANHPQAGGFGLPPTDARVVVQQRQVDKLSDDLRRLQIRAEARAASWREASAALARAEDWLKHSRPPNCLLEDHEGPEPKLSKGEHLLDAIENRRRRVRELVADLSRISSSPFPIAYCKQKMRVQIERLAQSGAPDVSILIEHDRDVEFPMQRLTSEVFTEHRALAVAETSDALALTCWLHRDALIAALDRSIESESDDKSALTHAAREVAAAEVQGDLLLAEREETFFVFRAWGEGLSVEHRADVSSIALLGLRLVVATRAATLPGTSPEHGFDITRPGGR